MSLSKHIIHEFELTLLALTVSNNYCVMGVLD